MPPLLPESNILWHRFIGFLIWQSVSKLVFSLSKTLASYLPNSTSTASSSAAILPFTLCFVVFQLSRLTWYKEIKVITVKICLRGTPSSSPIFGAQDIVHSDNAFVGL